MKNFSRLTLNTIFKELKSNLLLFAALLTIVLLFLQNFLIEQSVIASGDTGSGDSIYRQKISFFFLLARTWTSLLAAMIGIHVIRSDIDYRIIAQILSSPVSKLHYFLGRVCGAAILCMVAYLFSILIGVVFFWSTGEPVHIIMKALPEDLIVTTAMLLAYSLFAIIFSLFLPRVLAFISTIIVFFIARIGNLSYFPHHDITTFFKDGISIEKVLYTIPHYILPRLEYLTSMANHTLDQMPILVDPLTTWAHYITTMVITFTLGYYYFSRLDIK